MTRSHRSHRMETLVWVVLAAIAFAGSRSTALPILQGGEDTSSTALLPGYMNAYDFTPTTAMSLTALGFWDSASNGLPRAFEIGLWETASQTLLAGAIIDNSDPLDPSLVVDGGAWRYESLASPVALTPGVQYTLGFYVGNEYLIVWDALIIQTPALVTIPEVVVADLRRELQTPGFSFPAGTWPGSQLRVNVNALVTVPEPGTGGLVALGVLALTDRRWRARERADAHSSVSGPPSRRIRLGSSRHASVALT